eukprot:13030538-Heterocapsa_arctica.AAC.1
MRSYCRPGESFIPSSTQPAGFCTLSSLMSQEHHLLAVVAPPERSASTAAVAPSALGAPTPQSAK